MNLKQTLSGSMKPALAGACPTPRPAALPGRDRTPGWLLTGGSDDQDDTIRVRRRRPSGPSTGPRERAEAPQRRRPSEGEAPRQPTGGGGGIGLPPLLGGGGGRGCLGLPLIVVIGLVILAIILLPRLFGSGAPQPLEETAYEFPTPELMEPTALPVAPTQAAVATKPAVAPTRTPAPSPTARPTAASAATPAPPASATGQKWLVMLYQDADDKVLEQDIYFDLNEAERVGSTDRVQIVAQMDRFRGGFSGDGNWTSAKRFEVTRDDDLQRVRSRQIADLGEINMSDPQTLFDFVTWAMGEYPADKYVLIMSDHGTGWPGGMTDPEPRGRADPNIPIESAMGNLMYLQKMDRALGEIRARTGLDKFELIGMDACLMGHLEVYDALAEHARYAVASQEVEPALGWAYTEFLRRLVADPDISGADLGRSIVQSYIQGDQRIVDDQARAEFMLQGSPMGSFFDYLGQPSPEQLARQMEDSITLTVVDLAAIPQLVNSVNTFSAALADVDQALVARARTYARSFTSVFGQQVPPSYIDLGSLAQLMKQVTNDPTVTRAADGVLASIGEAVLAERHGSKKAGASGISIYFPVSQLYRSPVAGPQSYTAVARRFAEDSAWDDFLAYHFAGRPFEPTGRTVAVPGASAPFRSPGAGGIQIGPLEISGRVAAPGRPVTLRAKVTGDNVGYAYIFAGYYDREANSIYVSDMDYLESPETREADGVYYPDWGDAGHFTLEFDWEPLTFAITDGTDRAQALLMPRLYGASPEDAVYSVDGIYTFADGTSRSARLYFSNGLLRQVFGYTSLDFTGAPREITPQSGDQFTVLERWLDLDAQGNVTQTATQEGKTLTFGDQTLTWQELDAAPGDYVVGLIVEDLDGNSYAAYGSVRVE